METEKETVAKPVRDTKSYEGFFLLMKNIKVEAVKHYKHVFGDKAIDVEFKWNQNDRKELCRKKLESALKNKTPLWSNTDVKNAIKGLGHPNEIFNEGVAGQDLLVAITILMNKLQDNQKEYPEAMAICNV